MAIPRTRQAFKDYCLRRLGHPVIEINIDEDQVDDRVDDALQYFQDYHFDGVEKVYLKHAITAEDMDRRWVYVPEVITGVTGILPFDDSNASVNMFDLRYQLRLHDLYDFSSTSYVHYEITMQHIRTLNLLFSGMPQIRFNRHMNKLFLDIDWTRDVHEGSWIIIECYRSLNPDNETITGTVSTASGNTYITGTGTIFDQELMADEEITVGSTITRVVKILSPNVAITSTTFPSTNASLSVVKTGVSGVWNDRFLKQYGTALIKKNWGENLSKFNGVQLPGGVTLNGQIIKEEATIEITKLEEDMQLLNVLPNDFLMG